MCLYGHPTAMHFLHFFKFVMNTNLNMKRKEYFVFNKINSNCYYYYSIPSHSWD